MRAACPGPSPRSVRLYVHAKVDDTAVSSCGGSSRSSPCRTLRVLISIRAPLASHREGPQCRAASIENDVSIFTQPSPPSFCLSIHEAEGRSSAS